MPNYFNIYDLGILKGIAVLFAPFFRSAYEFC